MDWKKKIFKNHSPSEFEDLAFEVFRYQMEHCNVYSNYVKALKRLNPSSLDEIPFLPISFFKSHQIHSSHPQNIEQVFKSSGTGGQRSQHFIQDLSIYHESFFSAFQTTTTRESYYGVQEAVLLKLCYLYTVLNFLKRKYEGSLVNTDPSQFNERQYCRVVQKPSFLSN